AALLLIPFLVCCFPYSVKALQIDCPMALATGGGNALPTWRYAGVFFPANVHEAGNPCISAAICSVRRGMPTWSGPGGRSASPFPSTPIAAHVCLARVGPRSAPPCFFDPPTSVGAMVLACSAQCEASQPREAISAYSSWP